MLDLDHINPFSLPCLPHRNKKEFPECSGIYFILRKRTLMYIGKALNIRQRIALHSHKIMQHSHNITDCDLKISWLQCDNLILLPLLELKLIAHLKPKLNERLTKTNPVIIDTDLQARLLNIVISEALEGRKITIQELVLNTLNALSDNDILSYSK